MKYLEVFLDRKGFSDLVYNGTFKALTKNDK